MLKITLGKIKKSINKNGFWGFFKVVLADLLERCNERLENIRDNYSRYNFINRKADKESLVVILAGYKNYLWPATLSRMKVYMPNDADVCVVSAGLFSVELEIICTENNWSYLSVGRNSPGVALNKAIALHPAADFIYKLDEDIFVGKNFFQLLYEGYHYVWREALLEPGFCAPLLNVNGVSYRSFLRELDLESDYKCMFGDIVTRCGDLPVHGSPNTCWWIWRNTLPFDKVAARFSDNTGRYSICSTRFSIGAILFRRSFIEKAGGFKSAWYSGVLGVDEDMLCRDCVSLSRPMCIIESVFAGHFSFYPQEAFMREKLPEMSCIDPVTFPRESYGSYESKTP